MTLLRVNVGGLDFFGHRGPYAIGKDGFTGWDDTEYRSDAEARVNSHGNYPATSYREAKTVNLTGYILGSRADELNHRIDRFTSILTEGQSGKISVQRPWGSRWANCQVVSRKATEAGGLNRAAFALTVRIDDPRRFGDTEIFSVSTAGGSTGVFQRGMSVASPVITVSGNMPGGYRLAKGSKLITIDKPLGAAVHELDLATGILRIGGAVTEGGLNKFEWDTIAPGLAQSITLTPQTTGSGTAAIEIIDTYI